VEQVLEAVQRIQDLSDRFKVTRELEQEHGLHRGIAQWLAASLQTNGDTFKWGFGAEVAARVLPEFQCQDFIGMVRKCREGRRLRSLGSRWCQPRVERVVLHSIIPMARAGTKLQT